LCSHRHANTSIFINAFQTIIFAFSLCLYQSMKQKVILFFICLISAMGAWSQIYDDYEYKRELLWGVNKNTNSGLIGGFFVRHSRIRSERLFTTYGIELMNTKHPKEQKYTSTQTGTSFIWGKKHYLYSIRTHYGLEKLLFKKASQQGVQISAGAAGGVTVGLEAPYYVLTQGNEYEPYDPDKYPTLGSIQGSGRLLQGIGEASVIPGINGKTYVSFEFGSFRNNVAGVELGVSSELFTRKVILIPTQDNKALYSAAFVTFFWGTRR
jgi:hypothetical protein